MAIEIKKQAADDDILRTTETWNKKICKKVIQVVKGAKFVCSSNCTFPGLLYFRNFTSCTVHQYCISWIFIHHLFLLYNITTIDSPSLVPGYVQHHSVLLYQQLHNILIHTNNISSERNPTCIKRRFYELISSYKVPI